MIKLKHGNVSKTFAERTLLILSLTGFGSATILLGYLYLHDLIGYTTTFVSVCLFFMTLPGKIKEFKLLVNSFINKGECNNEN